MIIPGTKVFHFVCQVHMITVHDVHIAEIMYIAPPQ